MVVYINTAGHHCRMQMRKSRMLPLNIPIHLTQCKTVRERVKCNIITDVNLQLNRRVDIQTQTVALRVTYISNLKCADVFWASRWCQKFMDCSKTHAFENILALLIPNYWVWAGNNPVIQQLIQQSNGRSNESANRASDPKYESEPWVWADIWAKIQAWFSWDSQLWVLT